MCDERGITDDAFGDGGAFLRFKLCVVSRERSDAFSTFGALCVIHRHHFEHHHLFAALQHLLCVRVQRERHRMLVVALAGLHDLIIFFLAFFFFVVVDELVIFV